MELDSFQRHVKPLRSIRASAPGRLARPSFFEGWDSASRFWRERKSDLLSRQ
jgi:hypothetical protein